MMQVPYQTMILVTVASYALGGSSTGTWAQTESGESATRQIPARAVPVPSTVSPELRKFIARPAGESVTAKSAEEWKTIQRNADSERAELTRMSARNLGVTVEETKLGGVKCYMVSPKNVSATNEGRLLVHLHGGAYVFGAGEAAALEAVLLAAESKARIISVDYRMPPDHPYPAAIEDAVAVWKAVTAKHEPSKIAFLGTSAGGGLTMASVLKFKELNLPLPGTVFLGTPCTDLTKTGDSYFTNAGVDNLLNRYEGLLEESAKLYAGKASLKNPFISPVYGNVTGFPPTILITGTRDLFLSNTVRVHRKLRAAGLMAELHVYEAQSHADYLGSYPSPEAKDALGEVAQFFDQHLDK